MTETAHHESATIYAFPLRGRFAVNSLETSSQNSRNQMASNVVDSGAWYHHEAIRNDDHSRRN